MIYISKNDKNDYDLDDVIQGMRNNESEIYKQVCRSVINRVKILVEYYDEVAVNRAKKNNEPIENIKLINPRSNDLEATIKHFLEDREGKYGLIDKAIEDLLIEQCKENELKKSQSALLDDKDDSEVR